MDLTDNIYNLTKLFPKSETYVLGDQMRRSAVSIPSNIAEGQRRKTAKEFLHFLTITSGSCAELETQLLLAVKQGYVSNEMTEISLNLCGDVDRLLFALIKKFVHRQKNKFAVRFFVT